MSTKRSFLPLLIVSVLSAQHLLVNVYAKRCRSDLRIRKEFTSMSYHERRKYVDAYKIASTRQPFKRRYDYLVRLHQTLFEKVHTEKHFFPWHRWYLLQFENLFRYIHKDVTIPYWDWSIAGERIWATDSESMWSKKSWGLGGNGKGFSHCVKDGPFSKYKWRLAYHSGGGCLKRNFKGRMPNCRHVQRTLLLKPTQFKRFEGIVQDTYHNELHCCIGGTMKLDRASNTPEFLLHHAFLDKIWYDWQKNGIRYKWAINDDLNSHLESSRYRVGDFMDYNDLGDRGVALKYRDPFPGYKTLCLKLSSPLVGKTSGFCC